MFSCVMPVKGLRPYMDEALESLRNQGLGDDLEIIIQDGDVELDKGQSDALNKGFAKAHGEWLFWLNADDVLLPGALKAVKERASGFRFQVSGEKGIDWIAGNMMYIDANGKVIDCRWDLGWKCAFSGLPVQVYGPSSFFRRELLETCGGFDETLRVCMDTDMWTRFREHGYWFHRLPRYVWGFRRHAGSLTKSVRKAPEEMSRQAAETKAMHDRHGLRFSKFDLLRARTVRTLDGSYLKSAFDTFRYRGRDWREIYGEDK